MQESCTACVAAPFTAVLIVDDHPLYSDALADALGRVSTGCRIEKAGSLAQAMTVLDHGMRPDLVMFDLKLPDVTGISGFQSIKAQLPDTPILVISSLASLELVQSLLHEGAAGFLPKDASAQTLKSVLETIGSGGTYVPPQFQVDDKKSTMRACNRHIHPLLASLTPQQQRIMRLIAAGKPNKQIAYELSLAEATVKAHITALLRRLDVKNRTQAAVLMESVLADQDTDIDTEARAFLNR